MFHMHPVLCSPLPMTVARDRALERPLSPLYPGPGPRPSSRPLHHDPSQLHRDIEELVKSLHSSVCAENASKSLVHPGGEGCVQGQLCRHTGRPPDSCWWLRVWVWVWVEALEREGPRRFPDSSAFGVWGREELR